MSDRQLLESAAKAAGLSHPDGFDWIVNQRGDKWDPLTDEGDRYLLARKLKMVIDFDGCEVRWLMPGEEFYRALSWPHNDTEERCIVRAAAAIGEKL